MAFDPVLLLDMDGPLADFDAHYFRRCAEEGIELNCSPHEQTRRFASDHILRRADRERARAMVYDTPWFRDLPVTPGAIEGIEQLEQSFEVWIVTKPLILNATCRDDKAAWINEHLGSQWVDRLITTPDKSMIQGDILLDDAPLLSWFTNATWQAVIFSRSFNGLDSEWGHLPRWGWGDDIDILRKAIQ